MTVRALVIRGQFNWLFSQGMDALCSHLRQLSGVQATIWNWNVQQGMVDFIRARAPDDEIAIIGYSLGATYAPRIARLSKRRIDLLIGLDPSQSYLVEKIPDNVLKTVCFYNYGAWFLGGVPYRGKNVENIALTDAHLYIDWDTRCWDRATNEVRALS